VNVSRIAFTGSFLYTTVPNYCLDITWRGVDGNARISFFLWRAGLPVSAAHQKAATITISDTTRNVSGRRWQCTFQEYVLCLFVSKIVRRL